MPGFQSIRVAVVTELFQG